MKSKEVTREEILQPAKHFYEKSIEELKEEKLSPETDNLGNVVVSNKFRSPIKKFLSELDELVAYTQSEAPNNQRTTVTLSPPRSRRDSLSSHSSKDPNAKMGNFLFLIIQATS